MKADVAIVLILAPTEGRGLEITADALYIAGQVLWRICANRDSVWQREPHLYLTTR